MGTKGTQAISLDNKDFLLVNLSDIYLFYYQINIVIAEGTRRVLL